MRYYSSVAQQSTLTASITPSSTTIQLASTTGLPGSTPFTLSLDYGSANEELVDVTAVAGLSLTVTRAVDGTSATSHNAGAVVRHVSSGRDFAESRAHEAATANIHGLTGAGNDLVGTLSTQTLSNKTLNKATGSLQNVDIFNVGLFRTTVIGDSANTNQTRLAILENEISLRTMVAFGPNGALTSTSLAADVDGTYRIRCLASDATTDRFAVLAGGTMTVQPTTTTTFPALNVIAPDLDTAKRSVRVAASGGGSERFTVWNDGRVDIVGSSSGFSQFDVTGAPSQSADFMRVMNSGGTVQMSVQSSGMLLANKGATIAQPGVTSGAVLQVGGSNVGYTGNLQQWVGPANTILAQIAETGNLTTSGNLNGANLNASGTLTVTGATTLNGGLTVSGVGQTLFVRKTVDSSRAGTTTATDDTQLVLPVAANATYMIEGYLIYNAAFAADIIFQGGVPAGATGSWSGVGWGIDIVTNPVSSGGWPVRMNENNITQFRTFGGDTTDATVHMKGILITAGTAGNYSIQWAQGTSNATATILRLNSYIQLTRVA